MLGLNYGPSGDPLATLAFRDAGAISVYARHRDYHDVVKGNLKALASFLVAAAKPERPDVKVFVDTAPLMEKPLAVRAGIGWQGKHTNLVSREFGSWLFLGAILTDLELPPDPPETDHCGACRACLDACPTDAFPAPYRLDARRCISYLTIEHKGPIPPELRPLIGNRIYGCDDCLAVCPWNKFAKAGREMKLVARADLDAPSLAELGRLDEAAFRARFAGGPVRRIGRARLLRNVMIAIGNSGLARPCRRGHGTACGQIAHRARRRHLGARATAFARGASLGQGAAGKRRRRNNTRRVALRPRRPRPVMTPLAGDLPTIRFSVSRSSRPDALAARSRP